MSKQFELITFDCYGTLIDWEEGMRSALKGLLAKKNINLDFETLFKQYLDIEFAITAEKYRNYKEVLTISLRKTLEENGVSVEEGDDRVFADSLPSWEPFPESVEVLQCLQNKGYRLGILSNIDDDLIAGSAKKLQAKFDYIISAQQVQSYKPNPNHWKRLLEVSGLPKEKVLHVSVSYTHDLAPAIDMGFTTAWINRWKEEIGQRQKPNYESPDLNILTSIL